MDNIEIRQQTTNVLFIQDCLNDAVKKMLHAESQVDSDESMRQARQIIMAARVHLGGIALFIQAGQKRSPGL